METLFLDHMGIWRCGGRLVNAELQYNTKHPIFISKHHHLAVLIVRCAHERVFHNGVKDTLTKVRAKYWIVQGTYQYVGDLKEGHMVHQHHHHYQTSV